MIGGFDPHTRFGVDQPLPVASPAAEPPVSKWFKYLRNVGFDVM